MTPPINHPDVQRVGTAISDHLAAIADLFTPGVKLTLLARNSEDGERDMVLTNDSLDAAIRALELRRAKEGR